MARRAQQGSVADCPYCSATLPQLAAECPECRFPLTMAAADVGFRAPEPSAPAAAIGLGGRPIASSVLPGAHLRSGRDRVHGSRGHRLRITAWLLGLTSILLLLAGVGALLTATSPEAAGDREAQATLITAMRRATTDPGHRRELIIEPVPADQPSDAPHKVSSTRAGDLWFGASRSTSGRCFLIIGRADGFRTGGGTLAKDEPCTGAHIRTRYEERQAKAKAKP